MVALRGDDDGSGACSRRGERAGSTAVKPRKGSSRVTLRQEVKEQRGFQVVTRGENQKSELSRDVKLNATRENERTKKCSILHAVSKMIITKHTRRAAQV